MRLSPFFRVMLAVALVSIVIAGFHGTTQGAPGDQVRVWVEFQPGAKAAVQQALQHSGARFHYTFDRLNAFVVTVPQQALEGLGHNPNVVSIEEDVPR